MVCASPTPDRSEDDVRMQAKRLFLLPLILASFTLGAIGAVRAADHATILMYHRFGDMRHRRQAGHPDAAGTGGQRKTLGRGKRDPDAGEGPGPPPGRDMA